MRNGLLVFFHHLWHHHPGPYGIAGLPLRRKPRGAGWPFILTLPVLVAAFTWDAALLQPERFPEDVWTVTLGPCNLDYHVPMRAVARSV